MSSILFINGPILTMDPQVSEAEAVLVENDRIRAVGTLQELACLAPDAERYSLKGQCLLPGFVEAHIHVWKVGNLQTHTLDLRGTTSIPDLQERLRAFAAERPDATWVQARGFNEAAMLERRMPTRKDLDAAVPDRPVLVQRTCAHILVLNSLALEHAHITAQTPTPAGGEICLGPDGNPNGVLTETAQGLGFRAAPVFSEADYVTMVSAATETLLAHGFTTATDPGVMPDLLAVYRKMEMEKRLKMRF
ncbi:MAG TPA: amidohydrolase family protein, partial [Rhodothermales bacterium]|nr:amidohydrolase family protein [Rhodothermales bacterium]